MGAGQHLGVISIEHGWGLSGKRVGVGVGGVDLISGFGVKV